MIGMTFDQWVAARGEIGPGTNTGDGHVWPRPDGLQVRCGGPGHCLGCTTDATMLAISAGTEAMATGSDERLRTAFADLAEAAKALLIQRDTSNSAHALRRAAEESSFNSRGLFQQQPSWSDRSH